MKIISILSKSEKIIITFLALICVLTGYRIAWAFYVEHSSIQPVEGGTYIEGVIGKITSLNPLLATQGSVSYDVSRLVFSGLTKYDPMTKKIAGDIADYTVSPNGKEYTFVIKKDAKWHDGEPVTADDVLFTYNDVIKNSDFKGAVLNYNDYSGIKVVKVDERTIQFLLEKPDSFFLVKTMPGLLPQHLLANEAIAYLDGSPFNFSPVGSGQYRYVTQTNFEDHVEISLEASEDYYETPPHITNILIKVFPDFKALQKKLGELDGIRNIPDEYRDKVIAKRNITLEHYQLPQYVALFMNNESPFLKSNRVRLALQLATDKEGLIKAIGEQQTIDTPLLEIDQSNWIHQYSVIKANGALFDAGWKVPAEKMVEVTEVAKTAETPVPEPAYITGPNGGTDFQTTQDKVTLAGTVPKNTKAVIINDYELQKFTPGEMIWTYAASFEYGNLKAGKNVFDLYAVDYDGNKQLIDSMTITQGTENTLMQAEKEKLKEENSQASLLPLRVNDKDEQLVLTLITSSKPEIYGKVAETIKTQWQKIGVDIRIEILENEVFQQRLNKREYDLLIFGQNLGYNLDAYPYWHSSQAKEGGYNLSQFKNFVVDSLLEKARYETDEESRKKTLNSIQEVISAEAPAIFLYSPTYYFGLSKNILNASFSNMATASDRYASIETWYGRIDRALKKGTNPITFFTWIVKQF